MKPALPADGANKIRILVSDQIDSHRDRWIRELNDDPGFEVISTCSDTDEAIRVLCRSHVDAVLIDINCPDKPALEPIPTPPLLCVKEMIRMAAAGYKAKTCPGEEAFCVIVEVTQRSGHTLIKLKIIFPESSEATRIVTIRKIDLPH